MKYIYTKILVLTAVLALSAACQEKNNPIVPEDSMALPQEEMPFRLGMDGVGDSGTKGMLFGEETTSLSSDAMQILCFDKSGYFIGIRPAHIEGSQFYGYVPEGTAHIHFIANANLPDPLPFPVGTSERVILRSDLLSSYYTDNSVKLWGYHLESSSSDMKAWLQEGLLTSEGGTGATPNAVHLLRDRARIRLRFQSTALLENVRFGFGTEEYIENVASVEWTVTNGRDRGYIAPYSTSDSDPWSGYCNAAGTQSTVSMNEYTASGRYRATEASFQTIDVPNNEISPSYLYAFDDSNVLTSKEHGRIRLVLKLTSVNGRVKYILILLRDGEGNQIQITRNDTYILLIRSLQHEGYPSLVMAQEGNSDDFANGPADVDPIVPMVSDGTYTLTLVNPTSTSQFVKTSGTVIPVKFEFKGKDGSGNPVEGATSANEFTLYWEDNINSGWDINDGWDINNPGASDDLPTFNSVTGQWEFNLTISSIGHNYAYSDYLVIRHKKTGLSRSIHFYAVDEFKYRSEPVLTQVMEGGNPYLGPSGDTPARPVYKLSFKLSQSLQDDLFPLYIHLTSTTLEPYNDGQGGYQNRSTSFGIITGSTSSVASSSTHTDWNYNASEWGFWYEYKIDQYPDNEGLVEFYLKDVRNRYSLGDAMELGLALSIDNFPIKYVTP